MAEPRIDISAHILPKRHWDAVLDAAPTLGGIEEMRAPAEVNRLTLSGNARRLLRLEPAG